MKYLSLLISIIALSIFTSSSFAQNLKPVTDSRYQILSSVVGVHSLQDGDVSVKVLETASGDPASNGDHIFVSFSRYPEKPLVFRTDINVYKVLDVSLVGNVVTIKTIEHFLDPDQNRFFERPATYRITFSQDEITVIKDL